MTISSDHPTAPADSSGWLVRVGNQDCPAADLSTLIGWCREKRVSMDQPVFDLRARRWFHAGNVPELRESLGLADPTTPREWHVQVGHNRYSAETVEVLKDWCKQRRVRINNNVYHPSLGAWTPAQDVFFLRESLGLLTKLPELNLNQRLIAAGLAAVDERILKAEAATYLSGLKGFPDRSTTPGTLAVTEHGVAFIDARLERKIPYDMVVKVDLDNIQVGGVRSFIVAFNPAVERSFRTRKTTLCITHIDDEGVDRIAKFAIHAAVVTEQERKALELQNYVLDHKNRFYTSRKARVSTSSTALRSSPAMSPVFSSPAFCSQCGSPLSSAARFCGACGSPVGIASAATTLSGTTDSGQGLSTAAKIGIGSAVVGVAGAAIAATVGHDVPADTLQPTVAVDSNLDGAIDQVGFDRDGDGHVDAVVIDHDHDGNFDAIAVDEDGDGDADFAAADIDGDGDLDAMAEDIDDDDDFEPEEVSFE